MRSIRAPGKRGTMSRNWTQGSRNDCELMSLLTASSSRSRTPRIFFQVYGGPRISFVVTSGVAEKSMVR